MFASSLLSFGIASLIVELTPGPNMAYLALVSASHGRKAGMAVVAGVALGLSLAGVAAALGLAALIDGSPALFELMRWAAVGYFLWLAWDTWNGAGKDDGVSDVESMALGFRRGLVTNLLNPKAYVFYIAVVPSFVHPDGPVLFQTLILSAIFVLIATIIHTLVVVLAGTAKALLSDPDRNARMQKVFAVLIAGIGIWLAISL